MSKDYYEILGVNEFDSADDIKSAYKKLARKWHPDIAGNTESVLKMFKDINEAYETLSNSVKKEEYDRARRFYSYARGTSDNNKSETKTTTDPKASQNNDDNKENEKNGFNWDENLFKNFFGAKTERKEQNPPVRGKDVYTEIEISLLDAIKGCDKVINMLQTGICPKCKGKKFINGSVCQHCNGKGEYSDYKKFTVKIPAGIKNKSKIRLAGEGADGLNGGAKGDLFITVLVKEPDNCRTEGLNIYKTVSIAPHEAVLGADIEIKAITGTYTVKITPNTQSGQKIRLSGCGIVQNEKVGDMIITVEIKIPDNLSAEEILLYKRLAEISGSSLRDSSYDR